MSRVALTGGTGFLGRHVVTALLAAGHEVIALVRDPAHAALPDTVARVPFDLTRDSETPPGLRADALLHIGALSSPWGRARDFHAANVEGTTRALALARHTGASRFVFISSPSVLFRFADQIDLDETTPLPPPVNAYASSKQQAEALVAAATDLSTIILRPRGLYGPGDTALLPRLVRAARRGPLPLLREGMAVTDLTHVADAVRAVLLALDATSTGSKGIVHVSGGEALAIRHIVETACRIAGVPVRWRAVPAPLALAGARLAETVSALRPSRPEPIATAYSLGTLAYSQTLALGRARNVLGYVPEVSFAEGVKRL